MDAGVASKRGETEAHRRLKRLAVLWAQAQGYSACAVEVNLPALGTILPRRAGYAFCNASPWPEPGI